MSIERDKLINEIYEKILVQVSGGQLYGEYIMSPKELVVAAYFLGRVESNKEHQEQLKLFELDE